MRARTLPLAAVGAAAAGLGYALAEAQAYTVRRFTLPVLPPGSPALRVLHLSDLHLAPYQRRKRHWLHSLAALEPDLVVSTGDNLAHQEAVGPVLEAHGGLLNRPGVFVLGSNDYWAPRFKNPARYFLRNGGRRITGERLPTDDLVRGFRDAGWLDLDNARGSLTVRGVRLDFLGVDDPHMGYDRYPGLGPFAPGGADGDGERLLVGVMHAPYRRVLDAMASDGAKLLLAGHTHGGQLCLPGYGALVTNCDLDRRRARGVSRWTAPSGAGDPAWLHVSAGLGTSPFTPVRFACRPEASLLTLTPRSAPAAAR